MICVKREQPEGKVIFHAHIEPTEQDRWGWKDIVQEQAFLPGTTYAIDGECLADGQPERWA